MLGIDSSTRTGAGRCSPRFGPWLGCWEPATFHPGLGPWTLDGRPLKWSKGRIPFYRLSRLARSPDHRLHFPIHTNPLCFLAYRKEKKRSPPPSQPSGRRECHVSIPETGIVNIISAGDSVRIEEEEQDHEERNERPRKIPCGEARKTPHAHWLRGLDSQRRRERKKKQTSKHIIDRTRTLSQP